MTRLGLVLYTSDPEFWEVFKCFFLQVLEGKLFTGLVPFDLGWVPSSAKGQTEVRYPQALLNETGGDGPPSSPWQCMEHCQGCHLAALSGVQGRRLGGGK